MMELAEGQTKFPEGQTMPFGRQKEPPKEGARHRRSTRLLGREILERRETLFLFYNLLSKDRKSREREREREAIGEERKSESERGVETEKSVPLGRRGFGKCNSFVSQFEKERNNRRLGRETKRQSEKKERVNRFWFGSAFLGIGLGSYHSTGFGNDRREKRLLCAATGGYVALDQRYCRCFIERYYLIVFSHFSSN
ncbi:hypothetical protein ACLB2K_016730 [Fragaria x ananassa]